MENSFGANIYVDPLGRPALRIDNHEIEFHKEVLVGIEGDGYMDPYATMYLIVNNPQLYNQLGIKNDKNKGKIPMGEDIKAPPPVDPTLFR